MFPDRNVEYDVSILPMNDCSLASTYGCFVTYRMKLDLTPLDLWVIIICNGFLQDWR